MRMTRLAAGCVALLLAASACAAAKVGVELGAPAVAPSGDPPAIPAMTVTRVDVPGVDGGRLGAVAVDEAGVVAVGSLPGEAVVLFSPDGRGWARIGPVPALDLVDVAAGGGGFVAVGAMADASASGGMAAAAFRSQDGRSWAPVALGDEAGASATWVVAGPGGYRAGGEREDGATVSWSSADGVAWTPDAEPVLGATPAGDGWLELGDRHVRVVPAAGGSGAAWVPLEEPPGDDTILDVRTGAAGPGAMVVFGSIGKPCGPWGACAATNAEWVSTDGGTTWRLVPPGPPGMPADFVQGLAAGPGGSVLGVSYVSLAATDDGWHWAPIAGTETAGLTVSDAAPLGDGLVLVGEDTTSGDARPVIALAAP